MAQTPDFSFKGQFPMSQVIQGMQQKAVLEDEMRRKTDEQQYERTKAIMDAMNNAITGMVQGHAQQQVKSAQQSLAEAMGQTVEVPVVKDVRTGLGNAPAIGTNEVQYSSTPEGQARVKELALKAFPKESSDALAKNIFALPTSSTKTPQTINPQSVLVDGKPGKVYFVAGDTRPYDLNTQQPVPAGVKVEPYASNLDTPLTDEDRKRLGPLAQMVVEGRGLPQQFVNPRSPDRAKISMLAAELDPTVDFSKVAQRTAVRKDFSAGQTSKNLTSLNTVMGHLDTLQEKAKALDNKDFQRYNTLANFLTKETGKPEVVGFLAARNAVKNELGRVFQGVGAITDTERKSFEDDLGGAQSPQQVQEVVDTYIDLIKSRMEAIKSNWDEAMPGQDAPLPILNSKTKKILQKHGYDPVTMEKVENKSVVNPSAIDAIAQIAGLKKKGK